MTSVIKAMSLALGQIGDPAFRKVMAVGVVGALQFEVLADRIRTEYDIPVHFEPAALHTARWVEADDPRELKRFTDKNQINIADDHDGAPVFLARNPWHLDRMSEDWPAIRFLSTKEQLH